jgi:glycosyltransferase involved in cell wall biosynthesis
MRILFLLTQDLESPSGLGRYWPLARELTRLGHIVTVAALHSNFEVLPCKRYKQDGVNIWYVAPMHVRKKGNIKSYYSTLSLLWVALRATWRLIWAVLCVPADIIHIGKPHPMNSVAGLLGGTLPGRRVFLDCDDFEADAGHFSSRWQKLVVEFFEKKMPFWVDIITTNTYCNRDRIVGNGVPAGRVFYLSNGVDRNRFVSPSSESLQELRDRMGLNNKKVVLFLGSLSRPSHPVGLLLEAFKQISQVEPSARLLLVGGGDDFNTLSAQVQEMGLKDIVFMPGRVSPDQAVFYYHLADVSVDPVQDDAAARGRSPLKLFESWACGVPFVSADVGDRRVLLGEPPAGLVATPDNHQALAERILQILNNQDLAKELRERGLERVKTYFWDQLALKMDLLYRCGLPKRPTGTE